MRILSPTKLKSQRCPNPETLHLPLLTEGRGVSLGYREHKISKPSDLVRGTLDMLLLKIVALEPMNGFAARLTRMPGDVLEAGDASLCPALPKLWITAEVEGV